MTAERFSASIVNRLSLSGPQQMPQGYFRSKLFIAPSTTNPLVAAAGPLLSLLERLYLTPSLPPINSIRENIEHELRAFHSRLDSKTYGEELDALAHYLLCATIDELLGKNYLRLYGKIAEFQAFTPSSQDEIGPEKRFFDIIQYIKERPNQYLDLIELAYYCLITGFEGEQHGRADGRQVLDNLIEELYELIKQHRVNKSHQLFRPFKTVDAFPKNYKPLIAGSLLALAILAGGYFISYFLLEKQAKLVQFGHTVTARLDD
ncbi:type IVB secretion system protein IcmH/DotU [Legionella jordanis]|uniref:IcmH (DotU) n=1 Tax=Legionella jordanis TaxID=456 RepID=A0A0W0VE05_9GAMM|nr:type IVB secretion system protein IcmH/DotU [Legionella jordanis]KTD18380.1 IcmH (DotU) [Legionella jordanis]RMX05290.1 DotU family type IV/VI secretion system protein [Legionella jordanis]RMX20859.1 DotU family type IV/VI secretion system protein [Legionella jordanis]VEH13274.1 IcmH (DotU) [Legionella jordanis]HAT8713622.1 DotU family type IV/VI secretion system protein [Legionella jordanis]